MHLESEKVKVSIEIVQDQVKKVKIRTEAMPKKDQNQKHLGFGN